MQTIHKQSGFIKMVIIIVVALIILGYLGFDVRSIVESELVQKNLSYVWNFVVGIWNNYLERPIMYLWNDIFIDLIWDTFVENMHKLKAGEPTNIDGMAESIIVD